MEDKKTTLIYRILRWLVWFFYPRVELVGTENLPEGETVIVGNHSQMNGPIVGELYIPGRHSIWCAGQMMHWNEVSSYAYTDFWSFKPRATHWFFRILSVLIAPLCICLFNNAHTIPVYHDTRLLSTFRQSIEELRQGSRLVIFPEYNRRWNNILYDFQDRFIDLARMYYKRTGKALSFVPMYIAPKLHKTFFGKPIVFDPDQPMEAERERICRALMDAITELAAAQPEHTVVPYRNIPKRLYPKNIPIEVYSDETTPA